MAFLVITMHFMPQKFILKEVKKMSYKLCNEYLNCGMNDCPSFNNTGNDNCWAVASTLCKDPSTGDRRPKTISEKKAQCFGSCKYRAYRTELGA